MHILSASASDFIENLKELDFQNLGIDEFTTGEPVKLNLDNPSDLNSIRYLFGQILATQLRLKNYLIQQKGSFAFHATLPQRVESFGLLESWPGFEYQFDLIKDDLYLIIDSKYKLNWLENLRSTITLEELNNELKILDPIKDICSETSCNERKDSYCRCKLGGDGQTVYFHELSEERPSENFDVISYLDGIKCPTQLLKNSIIDEKPTLIASTSRFGDSVKFPIERISMIPSIDFLKSRVDTKELTSRIQPSPYKRYGKIMEYFTDIEKIAIQNLDEINLADMIEFPYGSDDAFKLERKEYQFKNGYDSKITQISTLGSYFEPSARNFYYLPISDPNSGTHSLIEYLTSSNDVFHGIFNFLGIENISIIEITRQDLGTLPKNSVVLSVLDNDRQETEFNKLRFEYLNSEIYFQKITVIDFNLNLGKRIPLARNHLRNVSLGWLSKAGGTPYLVNSDQNDTFWLGWFIQFRKMPKSKIRQVRMALTLYKSDGQFLKSLFLTLPRNEYTTNGAKIIQSFIDAWINTSNQIRIVKLGRIYEEIESPIFDELKTEIQNVEFVIIKEGTYRIFKTIDDKGTLIQQRPVPGLVCKLSKEEFLMITTYIRDEDKNRTQQPIHCKIISEISENNIQEVIEGIYDLTYCHHGYTLGRTKLPIPLHASQNLQRFFRHFTLQNGYQFESEVEYFL